jgi:hypothetical protein
MQGCAVYFLQESGQQMDRKCYIQLLMFKMWTYICTHTLQFSGILYANSSYETNLKCAYENCL